MANLFICGGVNKSGGGGIPLGNVTNLTAKSKKVNNQPSVQITWDDPTDIVVEGVTLATWGKTIVVRKVGGYPTSKNDGVVITTSTVRNQYSTSPLIDTNVEFDIEYYYSLFPVTTGGLETSSVENRVSCIPKNIVIYGVKFTGVDPQGERTDGAVGLVANTTVGTGKVDNDFDNIYPWSEIKQVYLNEGGTESATATNYVMMRIPKFYVKTTFDGTYDSYQVCEEKADGFRCSQAFLKDDGTELDYIYVSKYQGYINGTKLESKSGVVPSVSQTRSTFRQYAKNVGMQLIDMAIWYDVLVPLIMVEFANRNTQDVFKQTATASGYSAPMTTGLCNSMKSSGTIQNTTNDAITWRGIENLWTSEYTWVDGLNMNLGKHYVCSNPSQYNDSTTTGYSLLNTVSSDLAGYPLHLKTTSGLEWCPYSADTNGSNTTGYCDYFRHYYNSTSSNWYVWYVGGGWGVSANFGLFFGYSNHLVSYSNGIIGSRLSYRF